MRRDPRRKRTRTGPKAEDTRCFWRLVTLADIEREYLEACGGSTEAEQKESADGEKQPRRVRGTGRK